MKKFLFPILMTVLIAFAVMPFAAGTVFAGTTTDNQGITYTLDDKYHTAVVSSCDRNILPFDIVIPSKVTDNNGTEYTVTGIGNAVFKYNNGLNTVTFEENSELKTIGEHAFDCCFSLKAIMIPAGVTNIGESAFTYCTSFETITIPQSVTSIGNAAFSDNRKLQTVTFEENSELKTIGRSAFKTCKSLETITIPASVTSIGNEAFNSCEKLTAITIPKSVNSLGEGAFDSSGLESVTFETGISLETIGPSAFRACSNLKTITIPASITSLGEQAFESSSGLQSITFEPGSCLETIGGNAFTGTDLSLIHYLGEEDAWEGVTKSKSWALDLDPAVHCVPNKTTEQKATPDADGGIDRYLCDKPGCGDWGYGGTVIRRPVISLSETSFVYDGTVKKPTVIVKDTAEEPVAASDYSVTIKNSAGTEIPDPVEEGLYRVNVTMQGDKYEGTKALEYIIGDPISIQDAEVVLSAAAYTYNGIVQKPDIGTIGGMDLTEGTDYTAVWSNESSANAGTYTVTITGKDFYTGTTSASYTIDPKVVTPTVKVSNKVYTGKALKPVVTVRAGTVTFKNGTDYTVGYSNNTKVGKASAKVTMKGNYKGSKTATFKILPKKAGISKAVPGKKLVKVTMSTKVSATGGTVYQIQYRIKGAAKWKTTTTKNKTKTIKKLKKGKQYQIRVRAYKSVSGSKYYGAWSKVKTTKKVK